MMTVTCNSCLAAAKSPRSLGTFRQLLPAVLACLLTACSGYAADGNPIPLRLTEGGHNQVKVSARDNGVWEIEATGGDPFVLADEVGVSDLTTTPLLSFEYICIGGLNTLQVFASPGWGGNAVVGVPELPERQGWSPFAIDVTTSPGILARKPHQWRIDLGSQSGKVIQIRNLQLRARSVEEVNAIQAANAKRELDRESNAAWEAYLSRTDLSGALTEIVAGEAELTVKGTVPASPDVFVAEWPVWQTLMDKMQFTDAWPVAAGGGAFAVTIPRFAANGRDRALSRFILIYRRPDRDSLLSHGRWVDVIPAAADLPALEPRSKKGLGGFSIRGERPMDDLDELGIATITVNITLTSLFQPGPGNGAEEVVAGGRTWFVRRNAFNGTDGIVAEAAKRKIVVLAIILVPPARQWGTNPLGALLQHPDYDPAGIFTMPNITTAESTVAYGMALELLAKRYSRADGRYGRIHHWIMHNEVDMGWVWTNCGKHPRQVWFDQYYRSMRLAFGILRRQDANARVYISLTHHWAATGDPNTCFPSRDLLSDLVARSQAEGDFDWGVAYHPYPSSLFEPKTWLDKDAKFSLDTPKITFRNIEVLDAWAKLPSSRYLGTNVRSIHLSEQGPNSRDYSDKSLQEQAAAMAYVWKKIAVLDSIQGFEYHNWIDNRHEGGLRIGLRRFPDDGDEPLGKKPIWQVYKALGTPEEDAACAFALPIIGIDSWEQALYRGEIPAKK